MFCFREKTFKEKEKTCNKNNVSTCILMLFYHVYNQLNFSALYFQMKGNNRECLLLYDEIASLYEQLENSSNGSQCDRKILLSLNGGDAWSCASQNSGNQSMKNTLFNYTGKIISLPLLPKVLSTSSLQMGQLYLPTFELRNTIILAMYT